LITVPSVPASFVLDDEISIIGVTFSIPVCGTATAARWRKVGVFSLVFGSINFFVIGSMSTAVLATGVPSGAYNYVTAVTTAQFADIASLCVSGGTYSASCQDFGVGSFIDSVSSLVLEIDVAESVEPVRVYPNAIFVRGRGLFKLAFEPVYFRFVGNLPVCYQIDRDVSCDYLFLSPGRFGVSGTNANNNLGLRIYRGSVGLEGLVSASLVQNSGLIPFWTGCGDVQQFVPFGGRKLQAIVEFYTLGSGVHSGEFALVAYREV
jgi:hypothetical protein